MFSEDYRSRFAGVARLYGVPALEKLARSRVCLVGLGGVGSWTCEALARSGVGALTLIDADDVRETNANRQIHALDGNFGRPKAEVLAERVRLISPHCAVRVEKIFITPDNASAFFEENRGAFDLVVDAIDGARNKAALIAACVAAGTPVVSSGGCAGKRDGARTECADLADAEGDALLGVVRRELRSRFGFSKGNSGKKIGVRVVFSRERPLPPEDSAAADAAFPQMISPAGGRPRAGTAAFVTGAFGLALAQLAVETLISSAA